MITEIKKTTEQKMQKSLEALKADLGKVRTGRAHTGLLDHVMVDYYGSMTPVNMVANITLVDDDENIVASVSLALESHGHKITAYHDGASGLEALEKSLSEDIHPAAAEQPAPAGEGIDVCAWLMARPANF